MTSKASIRIWPDQELGLVSQNIYGHFVEHLGACAYGGIWAESRFGGQREGEYRKDTLDLIKALRPPVVRWPGGCFSELYHWKDGIGPRHQRPVGFDWIWQKPEPNTIGTHEFIDFCRRAGAEPVIAANARTGTADEAAEWVSYCNSESGEMAAWRTQNGSAQPFNVKLWDIGNEGWDLTADGYARKVQDFSSAMRAVDPDLKLVAVGSNGGDMDWNRTLLQQCGGQVNYIAPHHYIGVGGREGCTDEVYYRNVAMSHRIEDTLLRTIALVDEIMPHRPDFGIALDEWGVWWEQNQGLRHNYDQSDAVIAASVLNCIQRLCRRVTMANWAQLVTCLGVIMAEHDCAYPSPVYEVFRLYRNLCQEVAIRAEVECDVFPVEDGLLPDTHSAARSRGSDGVVLPVLDVSATTDQTRSITVLCLVNRSLHPVEVAISDFGASHCMLSALSASSPFDRNTRDHPGKVLAHAPVSHDPALPALLAPASVNVAVFE